MSMMKTFPGIILLACSLLAVTPATAQDERRTPHNMFLKTSTDPKTRAYYYAPPAAEEGVYDGAGSGPAPVIFFSGLWGWRPLVQDSAFRLASHGHPVLGVDSPGYFKKLVGDAERAKDLRLFIATVNEQAGRTAKTPVILVGFDYGADMIPYMINQAGTGGIMGLVLISPGEKTGAVFRVALQLDMPIPEEEQVSVSQEVEKLPPLPVALVYGSREKESPAQALSQLLRGPKKMVRVPRADHNFRDARDAYFSDLVKTLAWLQKRASR